MLVIKGAASGVIIYVIAGKLLNLSRPQFPHLWNEGNIIYL